MDRTKPCFNCKNITKNPKFCSRSCAAKTNNILFPRESSLKKKERGFCIICNIQITRRRKFCHQCFSDTFLVSETITIEQITGIRKYQKNSRIRNLARVKYKKSDLPKYCIICNYNKHYEVCHIKAINKFFTYDTLSQVNSLDNLVALCPNHHWEFDNGFFSIISNK